jgi:hypothetical protein
LRRPGSVTAEWILLFTLVVIGALAGFAALNYAISRQQDALGTSVEGMNYPAATPSPVVISSSASSTAAPNP